MEPLAEAIRHLERGDWEAAHRIVQDQAAPRFCWAHGIVHLMEGDLGNAGYWYQRAVRRLPDVQWEREDHRAGAIAGEIAALKRA